MRPDQALKHLLRSHGIAIVEEDIRFAFEENTREIVTEWVQQYLGNETLLSKEEAELYSVLERNGIARRIAASCDLDTVRPFLDEDIETALNSLEISTSAIAARNRTLKLKQEALNDFQAFNHQTQAQYSRISALRQRNRLREKQNTDLAVEELLQSVVQNATLAQRQLQAFFHAYPNRVTDSLRQDDNLLRKLEEMAMAEPVNEGCDHQKSRIQALCARLLTYTTEEIRIRLDRRYLESIRSSSDFDPSHLQPAQAGNLIISLKEELETLYPEINAVAQISIGQSFEAPLAERIEKDKSHRKSQIKSVFDDVDATFSHLQEKATQFVTRLLVHEKHLEALSDLLNEVETVHPGAYLGTLTFSSPTTNHHSEDPDSSKSTPATDLDSTVEEEGSDNLADMTHRQLLQLLGVPPLGSSGLPAVQVALDAVIYDRAQNVRAGLQNLSNATESALTAHLNNAVCTNNLLLSGLLEDTEFHNIELFDPHLKSRASGLKMAIDKIRSDMADLDTEEVHLASSKREDFVNKWLP